MADPVYLTINEFPGTDAAAPTVVDFNFAGGYISPAHVKAEIFNPVTYLRTPVTVTDDNFVTAYRLSLPVVVPTGSILRVYRDTPKDQPLVDFTNGARIAENNLDLVAQQAVFVAAESADQITATQVADVLQAVEAAAASAESAQAAAAASADSAALSQTAAQEGASAAAASAAASSGSAAASAAEASAVRADLAATASGKGAEMVAFKQAGTGAVDRTASEKLREFVSVKDFGAIGDGVTDDTAAIQTALNAAKGADATGVGRTVFSLHIPNPVGGFYKITDTLVIDGTHGLHIFGDGALTEREATEPEGVLRWYGASSKPVVQIKGGTGSPSNPNFQIKISDLTISGHSSFVQPGSVPADLALSGIHIGAIDGQNENTLTRNLVIDNVRITDCRFGIWSGNPDGLNTDHASVYLQNSYINRNAQAGVRWGTGNAILEVESNHITNNGWGTASFAVDDYSGALGANVLVNSGYVNLVGLTTAGSGTYKPTSADIYQESGRVSIINAWSDTEGFFLYQGAASQNGGGYHVGQITGVRHYNASFTEENTPDSLHIAVPGTFVSSSLFYGNVVVKSGLGGRPVFSGINFARANATFTGDGVQTQRSLINIGSAGNSAQMLMGGADAGVALAHKGNKPPRWLSMGNTAAVDSVIQALGPAASSSGFQVQLEESTGQFRLLVNGFFSGTDSATPLNANKAMFYVTVGGSTNLMTMWSYDPNGSSAQVALSAFTKQGGFLSANSGGSRSEVTFQAPMRSGVPSYASGDYWEGSIYYDTTTNKLRVNTGASTWVDLH